MPRGRREFGWAGGSYDLLADCGEFVVIEEGSVFNLLAITNNAGGHSFFVPDAEWVPGSFLEALRIRALQDGAATVCA